jgi:hypothetical protein
MPMFRWDLDLMDVCGFGCLIMGSFLLFLGARAAGSALLGSLAGAVAGVALVSSSIDPLPYGAVVGASAGTVVFGLLGLAWEPAGPLAPHLKTLALLQARTSRRIVPRSARGWQVHPAARHRQP